MKSRFFVSVILAVTLFTPGLHAAETAAQIIAKARAYLGKESVLNSVTTVTFSGHLESVERVPSPEDATKFVERPVRFPIEITFQKPYQQRIVLTRSNTIETTALDGYEAWRRRADAANPTRWQLSLLNAREIKQIRANTWENLNFCAGLEKVGGSVSVVGEDTVDGKECTKVAFKHSAEIVFMRYFDKATGRLVKTETDSGGEIREEGELVVSGIRFPRKVINKAPDGQTTTIVFEKAAVNQLVAPSEFAVPAFQPASP